MATGGDRVDYFGIDDLLSDDERLARDTIARLVDRDVIPRIGRAWLAGEFPRDLIGTLGALRVYGANLPEEFGCAGLNNVAYGLIMQELERGDSGIRSFASVQGALVMYPIFSFGSDEQKKAGCRPRGRGGDRLLRIDGARFGSIRRG